MRRGTKKQVIAGWASLPSETHRTRNEDRFFVMPERGFFGIFDGMGGHAHADLAAHIASEEVQEMFLPLAPGASDEAVADTIRDAFFAADEAIRAEAPSRGQSEGLGTTALVAILRPVSPDAWSVMIGWVGDSRAYLLSVHSRTLQTLTLDDSVVRLHAGSAASARKLQASLGQAIDPKRLSLRERDVFLERHVLLQAVGTSLRHVHISEDTLADGDTLILTTDGVHDNLTDREMSGMIRKARTSGDAAKCLVTAAQERSRHRDHFRAKPDDMTSIVVRLGTARAR